MQKYVWIGKQLKKRVHLVDQDGRTLCKTENTSPKTASRLDTRSDLMPSGRKMCGVCLHLNGSGKAPSGNARSSEIRSDHEFYASWEWAQLRYEVLKKHGPRCMLCGVDSRTHKIVVDHIKPRKLHPELELEFNNMQVLCDQCNRGKGRHDDTDWRDLNDELDAQANSHMKAILGS